MTRRRVLLVAAAACLLLLLAAPFIVRWAMTPAPGVTLENFKRLHTRMTVEEMNAIMGKEANSKYMPTELYFYKWTGNGCSVDLIIMDGHKGGRFYTGNEPVADMPTSSVSFTAKIRRWLGL